MIRSFLLYIFLLAAFGLNAQQEQHYTQFMYNKLGYNPGYAGSTETGCFTGIYRKQWIGLDGAPATQLVSYNTPLLNKRIGVGIAFLRNTIGAESRLTMEGSYAYRLILGRGTMGIGLNASIRRRAVDWSDPRIKGTQPIGVDPAIASGFQSKWVPNFGIGLYYSTNSFYVGASIPRILKYNIDFSELGNVITREVIHAYLMAGYDFKVAEKIRLQPQVLLKYAQNSPFDFDLNLMGIFSDRFNVGVTYRAGGSKEVGIGESIDFLLGMQATKTFFFGLSYDVTLSEIKQYSNGSLEATIRYCLGKSEGTEYVNPRFF